MVSDPKGETGRRYGVVGLGGLYSRRWTFYIDREGILRAIDKQVVPATAGVDMLKKLDELGFPRRSSDPAAPPPPAASAAPE